MLQAAGGKINMIQDSEVLVGTIFLNWMEVQSFYFFNLRVAYILIYSQFKILTHMKK